MTRREREGLKRVATAMAEQAEADGKRDRQQCGAVSEMTIPPDNDRSGAVTPERSEGMYPMAIVTQYFAKNTRADADTVRMDLISPLAIAAGVTTPLVTQSEIKRLSPMEKARQIGHLICWIPRMDGGGIQLVSPTSLQLYTIDGDGRCDCSPAGGKRECWHCHALRMADFGTAEPEKRVVPDLSETLARHAAECPGAAQVVVRTAAPVARCTGAGGANCNCDHCRLWN